LPRLVPIERIVKHNVSVTANTDILADDLTPVNPPCAFRIMVAFSVAGVFKAIITRDTTVVTVEFNAGSSLTADALYIFDCLMSEGDKVNFQYSVNATMRVLQVFEIGGGTM